MFEDKVAKLIKSYFPAAEESAVQQLTEDIIIKFTCLLPEPMMSQD